MQPAPRLRHPLPGQQRSQRRPVRHRPPPAGVGDRNAERPRPARRNRRARRKHLPHHRFPAVVAQRRPVTVRGGIRTQTPITDGGGAPARPGLSSGAKRGSSPPWLGSCAGGRKPPARYARQPRQSLTMTGLSSATVSHLHSTPFFGARLLSWVHRAVRSRQADAVVHTGSSLRGTGRPCSPALRRPGHGARSGARRVRAVARTRREGGRAHAPGPAAENLPRRRREPLS